MYNPVFADIIFMFTTGSIIWVQWSMIRVFKQRLDKAHREIQALIKYKAEKRHEHKYTLIAGELEMKYMGQTAKVRASFRPKQII